MRSSVQYPVLDVEVLLLTPLGSSAPELSLFAGFVGAGFRVAVFAEGSVAVAVFGFVVDGELVPPGTVRSTGLADLMRSSVQ